MTVDSGCPYARPLAAWVSIPAGVHRFENGGLTTVYRPNIRNSMSIWTMDECILRCRPERVSIPYLRVLDPAILRTCPLWCWRIDRLVMSRCHGQLPVSTKVDQEMKDYIDQSAEEAGVSRSEFLRRMLDGYRAAEESGECPECGTTLEFDHE